MLDFAALAALLGLLLVLLVVGLAVVRARGRKRALAPKPPAPGVDFAPGVGDDDAAPVDTPTRTVETLDLEPGTLTAAPEVELERPAPAEGRLARLRARLARSQGTLGRGLLVLLSRERLDDEAWEEIEDLLIGADVGVSSSTELVERLRTRARVDGWANPVQARAALREELVAMLAPEQDRSLATTRSDGRPAVVLVVGVNGSGKTTTVGKLARLLVAEDKEVLLGAADTFRAAAADQLTTWGDRVGVVTVRGAEGADPASVAFEAVRAGIEQEVDTVLLDTAGRLQTKVGLMDELGKVKRVVEKHGPVDEVLLVLDATTGQNGLVQAKVFTEVVDVSGVVLTKLDGTAKGGIVISVQRELGTPVKLVGLGEGPDDLAPFDPVVFVDGVIGQAPEPGTATPPSG